MAIFIVLLTLETRLGVFRVTGLKVLGRVGMNVFFFNKNSVKKYDFLHFERLFPFQNAQYSNFSRKPEKNSRFHPIRKYYFHLA